MARLDRAVAIVTGAAQGIGATYARALAAEGARVSVCDLDPPEAVVEAIRAAGGDAIGRVCDVSDPASVAALVQATERAFGGVQVLVNNAALFGKIALKPFAEIASEEWDRVMAVNTRGPFECVKAVLPVMQRQGYGKTSGMLRPKKVDQAHDQKHDDRCERDMVAEKFNPRNVLSA